VRELEGAQALLEAKRPSMTCCAGPLPAGSKVVTGIVTPAAGSHNHWNQVTAAHRDGH
jgi:hypothetical protein